MSVVLTQALNTLTPKQRTKYLSVIKYKTGHPKVTTAKALRATGVSAPTFYNLQKKIRETSEMIGTEGVELTNSTKENKEFGLIASQYRNDNAATLNNTFSRMALVVLVPQTDLVATLRSLGV